MSQQTTIHKKVLSPAATSNQGVTNPLYPRLWPQLESHCRRHLAQQWAQLIQKIRWLDQQTKEIDHDSGY
jgi:hypothetical protein